MQVTEEIEATRFNTGISAMMEFINVAYKVHENAALIDFFIYIYFFKSHM